MTALVVEYETIGTTYSMLAPPPAHYGLDGSHTQKTAYAVLADSPFQRATPVERMRSFVYRNHWKYYLSYEGELIIDLRLRPHQFRHPLLSLLSHRDRLSRRLR